MNFLKPDNSFNKNERLSKKTEIDALFFRGKSFVEKPVLVYYKKCLYDKDAPVKIIISVSKKKLAKAIDRNLIKRRIKEAYRKNKQELIKTCNNNNIGLNIAFVYLNNEIKNYDSIEKKIVLSLQKIIKLL